MKNRLNMWIFFPVIDDDCERIHSSRTAAHCFDSAYVAKQPVAWEEYCFGVLVKRTPGTIDRWTGRRGNTVESGIKHHKSIIYFIQKDSQQANILVTRLKLVHFV